MKYISTIGLLSVLSLCSCATKVCNPEIFTDWSKYESDNGDVLYLISGTSGCGYLKDINNASPCLVHVFSESGLLVPDYYLDVECLSDNEESRFSLETKKDDMKTLILEGGKSGKVAYKKTKIKDEEIDPNVMFCMKFQRNEDKLLPVYHEGGTFSWDGSLFLKPNGSLSHKDISVSTTFTNDGKFTMKTNSLEEDLAGTYTINKDEIKFKFTSGCIDDTSITLDLGASYNL